MGRRERERVGRWKRSTGNRCMGGGLDIVRENMYKPRSCGDDEE